MKTGTSKGYRDNWTIGFTREVTVGVWVGNFDGSPMVRSSGVTGAAPLFRDVMIAAMEGRVAQPLVVKSGLVEAEVCALSGALPSADCPHRRRELFSSDREPHERCSMHETRGHRSATTVCAPVPRATTPSAGSSNAIRENSRPGRRRRGVRSRPRHFRRAVRAISEAIDGSPSIAFPANGARLSPRSGLVEARDRARGALGTGTLRAFSRGRTLRRQRAGTVSRGLGARARDASRRGARRQSTERARALRGRVTGGSSAQP